MQYPAIKYIIVIISIGMIVVGGTAIASGFNHFANTVGQDRATQIEAASHIQ